MISQWLALEVWHGRAGGHEHPQALCIDRRTVVENLLRTSISYVVPFVEACGALVILLAVLRTMWRYVPIYLRHEPGQLVPLRLQLGQSLVMGIELQVAADILKTALSPTWNDMLLLASLIGLRTVLNYFLEREMQSLNVTQGPSSDTKTVGQ